jgi:hypothetical protein
MGLIFWCWVKGARISATGAARGKKFGGQAGIHF